MRFKEQLQHATVNQLNIRPPVTIAKSASVRDAVKKMRAANMGCVIAVDDDDVAVGMFTEGMLRHAIYQSVGVLDDTVENQMVARLPWVLPTDDIGMVLNAMEEHNVRFIAVLDDAHHVIGITGQKSMLEFVADAFSIEAINSDATSAEPVSHTKGN